MIHINVTLLIFTLVENILITNDIIALHINATDKILLILTTSKPILLSQSCL